MIKLSTIKPNPNNPRLVKDDKFFKLVESLKTFGDKMMPLRPMVIDEKRILLGGNMRYKALKELNYKEVPKSWVKEAKDLSEDEKREFIIKDNIGFGAWDWDVLANEWGNEDLEAWGLDIPEFESDLELEAKDDNYEEPEFLKVDVIEGDLIEFICNDGRTHRLICGDSTCSDTVEKLINGNIVELFLIDPPYNINFKAQRSKEGYSAHDDNMSDSEYINLLKGVYNNSIVYTNKCIVTCGKQNLKTWYDNFNITDVGIWIAKNKMSGGRISNLSLWEPILFIGEFDRNSRPTDLYEFNNKHQKDAEGHPCPKTISFFGEIIKHYSKKSILDLFLGSGTSLIASHQLKRTCYGMELDPKYCQLIIDRMQKLDSSLEVKINGKEYESKPLPI